MDGFTFSTMGDALAAALLLLGPVVAIRGVQRCRAAFPRPRFASMQPLMWMYGFRLTMIGLALTGVGAGWLWGLEWLLALSLAIGGEETLESSIAIHALRGQRRQAGVIAPRPAGAATPH